MIWDNKLLHFHSNIDCKVAFGTSTAFEGANLFAATDVFLMPVDSIHSGCISFGRFENEPLSWERRSSFSHNRYLEEVEKCSKPGSVIEKKAYFEAHFKRKDMFGFIPSTGHKGSSDRATSENDGSERNA
ncbi:Protein WVD2-like 7 [Glycine max]|nr:Protein WVD2-like 7 [Glycine max]